MANSWHAFVLFICITLIVFDLNHAAVRRRRTLPNIFGQLGRDVESTTRNLFQGKLGILSVNVVGGQKNNANNPCDPSQYSQQASTRKPALINVKIPSFFSGGRNQQPTPPPDCPPPTDAYSSENPNFQPYPSVPTGAYPTPVPQPLPPSTNKPIVIPETTISSTLPPTRVTEPPTLPPTQQLVQSSTSSLPPSSSTDGEAVGSTTPDLDVLIDSIFNQQEDAPIPSGNNGAGIIDLRWRGKQSK